MTDKFPNFDIWNDAWNKSKEEEEELEEPWVDDWLEMLEDSKDDEELHSCIQGIIEARYKVNLARDIYEAYLEEEEEEYWQNYEDYWGITRNDP